MLTITPKTPPVAHRAQTMLEDHAGLLEAITALQEAITTSLCHQEDGRSPRLPERDVRDTLNELKRKLNQAQREHADGRPMDALSTLQAIYGALGHQLPVYVRAWQRAETDPATRAILDHWLIVLDQLEVDPCSS